MKIMVTGYAGMNGSWTCRELLARGHDVIGVDTRVGDAAIDGLDEAALTTAVLDITDRKAVLDAVQRFQPDVIAHSAAVTATERIPLAGLDVNGVGSINILEAARLCKVRRVVFSSSKAVYGEATGTYGHPTYTPIPEEHPRSPMPDLRIYGATKYLVEEFGRHYASEYGVEFVALRFATIYGPGKQGPVGVVSRLIEGPLRGEDFVLASGGDQLDEFIYVKDVANGVATACEASALNGWAFNIGTGTLSSLHDIARALRPHIGSEPTVEIGPGLDYLGIRGLYSLLDSTNAREDLGFAPAFDLETGIEDYVRTVRASLVPDTDGQRS